MKLHEVPTRVLSTAKQLRQIYTKYVIVVLAFKNQERWVLLQGSIVLTTDEPLKVPSAPMPSTHFLLAHEIKDISSLEGFLAAIQNESKMFVNNEEIFIDLGEDPTWAFMPLERHGSSHRWFSYSGYSIIGRLTGATLSDTLRGQEQIPDMVLANFGLFKYAGLHDFGSAVFGQPISISHRATINLIVPMWSTIKECNLTKGIMTVIFRTPTSIHNEVNIHAAIRDPRAIATELQLAVEDMRCDYTGNSKRNVECRGTYEVINHDTLPSTHDVELDLTLAHKTGIALARYSSLIHAMSGKTDNPNHVGRMHFESAVREAAKCPPDKRGEPYPYVGAVLVKNGIEIGRARRGEIGRGDHAEFILLERKARGNPEVEGADLITTLEPCTTRSHDKHPCVSWIRSRRIRKVWIGTLDYNPKITGKGELALLKDGILIGRFPDDLTQEILEMNRRFFKDIESRQPTIDAVERERQRLFLIDMIRNKMDNTTDRLGRESLENILDWAIALQTDNPSEWCNIGSMLRDHGERGLSILVYDVSTRIDAGFFEAWIEKARVEFEMNQDRPCWPLLEPILKEDSTPDSNRSNSWFQIAEVEVKDVVKQLKFIVRAMQLGKRDEEIWRITQQAFERLMEADSASEIAEDQLDLVSLVKKLSEMWLFNAEDRAKFDRCAEALENIESWSDKQSNN